MAESINHNEVRSRMPRSTLRLRTTLTKPPQLQNPFVLSQAGLKKRSETVFGKTLPFLVAARDVAAYTGVRTLLTTFSMAKQTAKLTGYKCEALNFRLYSQTFLPQSSILGAGAACTLILNQGLNAVGVEPKYSRSAAMFIVGPVTVQMSYGFGLKAAACFSQEGNAFKVKMPKLPKLSSSFICGVAREGKLLAGARMGRDPLSDRLQLLGFSKACANTLGGLSASIIATVASHPAHLLASMLELYENNAATNQGNCYSILKNSLNNPKRFAEKFRDTLITRLKVSPVAALTFITFMNPHLTKG